MRVLCMIPTMAGPGGAERTMSYLVAHLAENHEVTLLTLDRSESSSFYPLPRSLRQVSIDKLGGRGIRRLWRIVSRPLRIRCEVRAVTPDIVISFMDTMNVTALIGCLRLGIPVVVSERNDPALNRLGRVKELLRDRLYPLAQLIVVQTSRAARYFPPVLKPKLRIIPNPVPLSPLLAKPEKLHAGDRLRLIAVGRLEYQKGFDQLIEAFRRIAPSQADWDLIIIGDGPERAHLEHLVRRFELENRVQMPGIVRDVPLELSLSHLMAFPSRYEGFPNALAEGLATGLPAVGYRGVSGVEDLIVDNKNGLLVDPKDGAAGLARGLLTLMCDARLRCDFGKASREHVTKWDPSIVLALWEGALREAGLTFRTSAGRSRGRSAKETSMTSK